MAIILYLILIGGAGILPKEIIDNVNIINSHPAYLPSVRGLDALKWAIYNDMPIGVTSHIISEEADSGFLIRRDRNKRYVVNQISDARTKNIMKKENITNTIKTFSEYISIILNSLVHNRASNL